MIEESPEGFIQHWRAYAADVQLFPRTEGSPMLECLAGSVILQLLDRTGPYQSGAGRRRVILNAMVEMLEPNPQEEGGLEVSQLGALEGAGRVVACDGGISVVDCDGVPLVVAAVGGDGQRFGEGSYVRFRALPPVHGFVMPEESSARRGPVESTDDAM